MATLHWTLAAFFLYVEMIIILILLIPWFKPRYWRTLFHSRFARSIAAQSTLYIYAFVVVLCFLLIESIRECRKYRLPSSLPTGSGVAVLPHLGGGGGGRSGSGSGSASSSSSSSDAGGGGGGGIIIHNAVDIASMLASQCDTPCYQVPNTEQCKKCHHIILQQEQHLQQLQRKQQQLEAAAAASVALPQYHPLLHQQPDLSSATLLLRAQRNFYVTTFALFCLLVIRRLVALINEYARIQIERDAVLRQAVHLTEHVHNSMLNINANSNSANSNSNNNTANNNGNDSELCSTESSLSIVGRILSRLSPKKSPTPTSSPSSMLRKTTSRISSSLSLNCNADTSTTLGDMDSNADATATAADGKNENNFNSNSKSSNDNNAADTDTDTVIDDEIVEMRRKMMNAEKLVAELEARLATMTTKYQHTVIDLEAIKQQAEATNREYDRLSGEYALLQDKYDTLVMQNANFKSFSNSNKY